MKLSVYPYILLVLLLSYLSCTSGQKIHFDADNVYPWCVLVFDSLDRTPTERVKMLAELGFKKYAYNWRTRHLDEMVEEFKLADENNLEIFAAMVWIKAKNDSLGKLGPDNIKFFNNLKQVKNKPVIWLGFNSSCFENRSQEESVKFANEMIQFVKTKTDELNTKIYLYNHRGWFGNPYNQMEVIESLPPNTASLVYNFHHAHDYIDDFPNIVKKIRPHLSYVNLNGMNKEGEHIQPLGSGEHEAEMIRLLKQEGYDGPWGILGHVETEDVKVVLERNMDGFQKLSKN